MQGQHRLFVITIFMVVVLSIFHSGEALKCYKCDSKTSTTCAKEPSSQEVETCLINDMLCTRYNADILGEKTTVRYCGIPEACAFVEKIFNSKDCSQCNTDLCNASATNAVSTIIIIISGLITLLSTIR